MKMMFFKLSAIFYCLVFLAACGGSNSLPVDTQLPSSSERGIAEQGSTSPFAGGEIRVQAGKDLIADVQTTVQLNGDVLLSQGILLQSVKWTQIYGDTVRFSAENSENTSFESPEVSAPTPLEFTFEAIFFAEADPSQTLTLSDSVIVTVRPLQSIVSVSNAATLEASQVATLNLVLSRPSQEIVTLDYVVASLAGDTAQAADDYLATSGVITFNPGETQKTLTVDILSDNVVEDLEQFSVSFSNPTNTTLATDSVKILITDTVPTVSLANLSATVVENAGRVGLRINMDSLSPLTVSIPFSINDTSTASAGADYVQPSQNQVIFPPFTSFVELFIELLPDDLLEGSETIVITLGEPSLGQIQGDNNFTFVLGESRPIVSFVSNVQTLEEGEEVAGVSLSIDPPLTEGDDPVTVSLGISETSTAQLQLDYGILSETMSVTINPGDTTVALPITIFEDEEIEPTELFEITMVEASSDAVYIDSNNSHIIYIEDHDVDNQPVFITFDDTITVDEQAGLVTVVLEFNKPAPQDFSISYTVDEEESLAEAGVDYTSPSSLIAVSRNQTSALFTIELLDDLVSDGEKEIYVFFDDGEYYEGFAETGITITVLDNEPTASFASAGQVKGELDNEPALIEVVLSARAEKEITLPFSIEGSANDADYGLAQGEIIIPVGASSGSISVDIEADGIEEGDETLILSLTPSDDVYLGDVSTHTLTILDEVVPTIGFAPREIDSFPESQGEISFTVVVDRSEEVETRFTIESLQKGSSQDITVSAEEYIVPPGQGSIQVTVSIIDDVIAEGDESFSFAIRPIEEKMQVGTMATVTVIDNEPTVEFVADPVDVSEIAGPRLVIVPFVLSAPAPQAFTVEFQFSGSAVLGEDYRLYDSNVVIVEQGDDSGVIAIEILPDGITEGPESIIFGFMDSPEFKVGNGANYNVTVQDPEPVVPTLSWEEDLLFFEETRMVSARLTLSAPLQTSLTIDVQDSGTADYEIDYYHEDYTVTIPAGEVEGVFEFELWDDFQTEINETINLEITDWDVNVVVIDPIMTITIIDDDIIK